MPPAPQPQIVRVIDLETTGNAPPAHAVIEIGWQDVALGTDGRWELHGEGGRTFVNPNRPIPPVTQAIHHILDEEVADAPQWIDVARQSLDPWLDQIVLPLVIHSFGGGRPGAGLAGLDGDVTWHYRNLPLLYARSPRRAIDEFEAIAALPEIAPLLSGWTAAERLIRAGQGRATVRPMFADYPPHAPERGIRKRLKQAELWLD